VTARPLAAGLAVLALLLVDGAASASLDQGGFVRRIDNPYFPLRPGTVFFYEGKKEGQLQENRVAVTRGTKTILGVKCVVVLDTVTVAGRPLERTLDWYAQDGQGNVWYMGENSRDYRHGRWVLSPGSWQAGVNGARAGIIMEAHPRGGDVYQQEYYAGHAEDMAGVIGLTKFVSVPYGTFEHVLVTREWTPLEPGVVEKKYYAKGIGVIQARSVKGDSEYAKLVAIVHR
jgi:hypothetical protein